MPTKGIKKRTSKNSKETSGKKYVRRTYIPKYIPEKSTEVKSLAISSVSATIPASAQFSIFAAMNPMAQGTNTGQRVGNLINMKRLRMRYTFYGGGVAAASVANTQCRILILYDKQSNGTTAAVTDYLNSANFNAEFRERAKTARFIKICDFITEMAIAADDADRMMPVSGIIDKAFDLQTVFSGATNNSTDIQTGTIIIAVAGNANVATATGILEFDYVIDYTDK